MSASSAVLSRIAAARTIRGGQLLVIGLTDEAMDLCACAMSYHAMQIATCENRHSFESGSPAVLAHCDIVYIGASDIRIDAMFLNQLHPQAWLVFGNQVMASHDRKAIDHAIWFETIGGVAELACDLNPQQTTEAAAQ